MAMDKPRKKSRNKTLEALRDEEIHELVSRLQAEIEQKNTELQTLTSNVTTIQTTIQNQQADRQKFSTYLLQAHEAEDLIEDNKKLNKELQSKEKQLKDLQEGNTIEQREVEELQRRLEAAQDKFSMNELDKRNKENILEVKRLEVAHQEKKSQCLLVRECLQGVKRDIASMKPAKRHRGRTRRVHKEMDKLIAACCKKAGLKLKQ